MIFKKIIIILFLLTPCIKVNSMNYDDTYFIYNDKVKYMNNITNNNNSRIQLKWLTNTTENFLTYTEVDESSTCTVTSSKIKFVGMPRNTDQHVYKDFGVGHFNGDYTVLCTIRINATSGGGSDYIWWCIFSNEVNDWQQQANCQGVVSRKSSSTYTLGLDDKGGSGSGATTYTITVGTTYYLKLQRTGTALKMYIYSDSGRTNLLFSTTQSGCQTLSWRYFYGAMGFDYTTSADIMNGEMWNCYTGKQEGYSLSGYYYTTNILDGISDKPQFIRFNCSQTSNTLIKVKTSSDNNTFSDWNVLPCNNATLYVGKVNYNSLYLLIQLETVNLSESPFIYSTYIILNHTFTFTNPTINIYGNATTYINGTIKNLPYSFEGKQGTINNITVFKDKTSNGTTTNIQYNTIQTINILPWILVCIIALICVVIIATRNEW